jgi:hypothetical protein
MAQSTDNTIKSASRAYVVFDKGSGEIVHIHHAITFSADLPTSEKPEARALRLAGAPTGLAFDVLEVESAHINNLKPIKVDIASRTIVDKITKS